MEVNGKIIVVRGQVILIGESSQLTPLITLCFH